MTAITLPLALAALCLAPGIALAGDPAKGEADFKKCRACHALTAPDGTVIQKGGKTGPDLYGVAGRPVAAQPGYKYSESLTQAGAGGLVWDEDLLAAYVTDPKAWLAAQLGTDAVKTNMSFRLSRGGDDMAAYLATEKP